MWFVVKNQNLLQSTGRSCKAGLAGLLFLAVPEELLHIDQMQQPGPSAVLRLNWKLDSLLRICIVRPVFRDRNPGVPADVFRSAPFSGSRPGFCNGTLHCQGKGGHNDPRGNAGKSLPRSSSRNRGFCLSVAVLCPWDWWRMPAARTGFVPAGRLLPEVRSRPRSG